MSLRPLHNVNPLARASHPFMATPEPPLLSLPLPPFPSRSFLVGNRFEGSIPDSFSGLQRLRFM